MNLPRRLPKGKLAGLFFLDSDGKMGEMDGIFIVAGRYQGKSQAMRHYIYDLWRRHEAGEKVELPYVVGPCGGPPPPYNPWLYDRWRVFLD